MTKNVKENWASRAGVAQRFSIRTVKVILESASPGKLGKQ